MQQEDYQQDNQEVSVSALKPHKAIKVYCTPEEFEQLSAKAKQHNCSLSSYLRKLGLDYQLRSIKNTEIILDLCNVNGDLGRIGGLFKKWLTDNNPAHNFSREFQKEGIRIFKDFEVKKEELGMYIKELSKDYIK